MGAHRKIRSGQHAKSLAHSGAASRDKYRLIVESVSELIALIGADGNIQYVNSHLEKVLGYRRVDVEGRNVFEFIHPDDVPRAALEFSDTINNEGERPPSVLRLRDAAGNRIPFEIIANNCLNDPAIQAVIFSGRDLRFRHEIEDTISRANADIEKRVEERTTELARINASLRIENQARRHAEERLQQTVSLLNATLDSTADGILVVSNEGKITSCNLKFVQMWRVGCEAAIGRNDQDLLSYVLDQMHNPNDFLDRVRSLYAERSMTSFDVLHLKDGRIFERYSQPQRIGDEIVGRVWSFRDVTRARNLEEDLRQSQKMEALGRLAGGIAHDFNNLLMLISGAANQLVENPALAEAHSISNQILATTRRAAAVTKQLLAFTRKHPEAPAVIDLNVVVLNMEHLLRRFISDQIELQVSVTSDPQPVYADVSQIELLIMNLSINAQDAMPNGGLLSIATGRDVPSDDSVKYEPSKTFAVLQVSDTGHGMSPEVRPHIFEPFFTTKDLGKGTGLGLSTVYGVVQRANGYIEVESEPNRGTTFRVYLPQVANVSEVVAPTPLLAPPARGHETILLAEDEEGIREMTRTYLEGAGYRVLEAADGAEAIRISIEHHGKIDLVLTDILMPGIRGDTAVAEIRKRRPEIKAIYMSGYTDQVLGSGANNLLYKPFEFQELGRCLRSVLESDSKAAPSHSDSSAA